MCHTLPLGVGSAFLEGWYLLRLCCCWCLGCSVLVFNAVYLQAILKKRGQHGKPDCESMPPAVMYPCVAIDVLDAPSDAVLDGGMMDDMITLSLRSVCTAGLRM